MTVRESVAVDTKPTTIRLYLPLPATLDEFTVVARDAQTHRTVGEGRLSSTMTMAASAYGPVWQKAVTGLKLCIGVSGAAPVPGLVHAKTSGNDAGVGYLDPLRLPDAAIGYDTLDVLVMNAPDLVRMPKEQQAAISDWVRGGGRMIYWPGPDAVPAGAPLASILPCRIGPPGQLGLSDAAIVQYGLQARFKKMMGRELEPVPGAVNVPLLDTPLAAGYRGRVGLGEVLVLPFDPSQLLLDTAPAEKLWAAVVGSVVTLAPPPADKERYNYAYQNDPMESRQDAALTAVIEVAGDVPGVGRFDFGYVAWAMIGLMVLVGPVDWFVLRKLGRQPWTWVTTAAWVGLITAAAVLIGQRTREGNLHFNTVQLVDEADGAAVATTTVTALYAPRTDNYELAVPDDSWWEPAMAQQRNYWGNTYGHADVPFHQSYRGNVPEPQRVNIWNERFSVGRSWGFAPATISGSLAVKSGRVIGTLVNNSDQPLSDVTITTRGGRAKLPAEIAPKATVAVDVAVEGTPEPPTNPARQNRYYGIASATALSDYRRDFMWYVTDLSGPRSAAVERWVAAGEVATVHAVVHPPAAPVQLTPVPAVESHVRVVRAIVPLENPAGKAGK